MDGDLLVVNVLNSKSRENTTLMVLDPYADPYHDISEWTSQDVLD